MVALTLPPFRCSALASSLGLHAAIVYMLVFVSLPKLEFPAQQIIPVNIIMATDMDADSQKKADTPKPSKENDKKQEREETIQAPVPEKVAKKTEKTPDTSPALSDIAPSAGPAEPLPSQSSVAASSVSTKPIFDAAYLNNPAPDYPAAAKRRGIEGMVMLRVTVMSNGQPRQVRIAESSGSSALDEAAKSAVERWKFIPAKQGVNTVEADVIVPIEFTLR